ncbi:MAG TPA: extracellular solute-binding protein [Thermomonospora sp.]|nr:extracellular solute-binding protein [Thermomonospora sp.]
MRLGSVRLDNLWLAVAAGLATFVVLAGWPAGDDGGPDACGSDVLRVAGGRDVSADHRRRAVIGSWRNPGAGPEQAELVELPGVADQQHSQLLAWARSSGCPAADVYVLDTQWIPEFARGGYIRPISGGDVDTGGVLRNALDAGRYEGRLWAVPFNTDAALLYYRTDLVPAPPRTWQEVWRRSAELLAGRRDGLVSGYAPQFADYEGMTVNALELIWSAGGDIVDRHGRVTVDSAPVRRLLATLTRLMGDERAVIERRALEHFEADSLEAFQEGRVAFMRLWPYAYAALANNERMWNADGTPRFAVTMLPGGEGGPGRSVLGGQSLAIDARSPHREAALSLIRHLLDEDNQRDLFNCGGYAPVLRAVYQNPGRCRSGTADRPVVHRLPDAQVPMLLRAVETARPRPRWPYYTEVSRVLSKNLRACLNGDDVCATEAGIAAFTDDLEERLTRAMRGG